jgi:hypothetical protein
MAYPVLMDQGTLGFSRKVDASKAVLSADFGGGYFATATVDDPEIEFSFTWRGVHRDARIIEWRGEGDETEYLARVEYIWEFVNERLDEGNSPFIIADLADGLTERTEYLVQLKTLTLTQQQADKPWLYGFAMTARRVRVPGESFGEITEPNPQSI